ncbi:MAG: stage II sporulation protein R [Limnochordia bacterium]|jgi:stage II sporulation protein R
MKGRDPFQVRLIITVAMMVTMFAGFAGLWGFFNTGGGSPLAFTRDNLLRLHVVAHSNSVLDQEAKLEVRDAILREVEPLLDGVSTGEEAQRIIRDHLPRLERAARITLAQGPTGDRPVELQLDRFAFPHRNYGSLALPAGEYDALRVVIGDGAGENWWCVLFPPLCFLEEEVVAVQPVEEDGEQIIYALRWKTWEKMATALEPWGQKALAAGKEGLANLLLAIPLWQFSGE